MKKKKIVGRYFEKYLKINSKFVCDILFFFKPRAEYL